MRFSKGIFKLNVTGLQAVKDVKARCFGRPGKAEREWKRYLYRKLKKNVSPLGLDLEMPFEKSIQEEEPIPPNAVLKIELEDFHQIPEHEYEPVIQKEALEEKKRKEEKLKKEQQELKDRQDRLIHNTKKVIRKILRMIIIIIIYCWFVKACLF